MRSTELRIRNLVHVIDRSGPIHMPQESITFVVYELLADYAVLYHFGNNPANLPEKSFFKIKYFDLSPVRIIRERLLNYSQIKLLYGECFGIYPSKHEAGDDFYCIQKHSDYWMLYTHSDAGQFDSPLTGINEFHILQNAFFDLTGEELEFIS